MHPAVLRLIGLVVAAARRHGKWVGVCGEAAADPVGERRCSSGWGWTS